MKEIKLLMIGNSFSEDTSYHACKIAQDMGFSLKLCNMYIGGCSLEMHLHNSQTNESAYDMQIYENGEWKHNQGKTLDDGILLDDWDYISFQQVSGYSGIPSSYEPLDDLMAYVKAKATNKNVRFIWHMTWAYAVDSTHWDFGKYENDQMKMYDAIIETVHEKIMGKGFYKIIPVGTAIQNARLVCSDDAITRDKFHLSYDLGRYIAGIVLVSSLFDADPRPFNLICPMGAEYNEIAKNSAYNAINFPFKVTSYK